MAGLQLQPGMKVRIEGAAWVFLGRKRWRKWGQRRTYYELRQGDEVQWYTAAEFRRLCGAARGR